MNQSPLLGSLGNWCSIDFMACRIRFRSLTFFSPSAAANAFPYRFLFAFDLLGWQAAQPTFTCGPREKYSSLNTDRYNGLALTEAGANTDDIASRQTSEQIMRFIIHACLDVLSPPVATKAPTFSSSVSWLAWDPDYRRVVPLKQTTQFRFLERGLSPARPSR